MNGARARAERVDDLELRLGEHEIIAAGFRGSDATTVVPVLLAAACHFYYCAQEMRNLARNGPLKFHCTREDASRASEREFDRERAQFAMALKILI